MAKSLQRAAKAQRALDTKNRKAFSDSFVNFAAKLGIGANNLLSNSGYSFNYITRNRTQLEAGYRTSWLIRKAVDIPAADMTREGIEFTGELTPEQISHLETRMLELHMWNKLEEGLKWGRLFGGSIVVPLLDGQDVSKPLKLDSIGKGQFKGLLVLDRWLLQPNLSNLVTELGPDMGLPKFYQVVATAPGLAMMKIHHSRVIRFEGLPLSYYQKIAENMWGESIVESIYDRLVAFDSGTMGAAQLLYKAHLRTISIDMLRDVIATGGEAYEALIKQMELIRLMQSNEGLTVLDAKDKFESHQYTFAGVGDVLLQIGQQLAGALDIPLVRLFGQSPAGLNATGESDLRTYYDHVKREQNTHLRRPVTRLLHILCRSELGIEPPENLGYHFKPVWCLTEQDKADIANKDADTMTKVAGEVSPQVILKELKQGSRVTGRFTNISDEDIADADTSPPKMDEPGDDDPEGNDE